VPRLLGGQEHIEVVLHRFANGAAWLIVGRSRMLWRHGV